MMRRRFASLILVDPLVNLPRSVLGLYHHLCVPHPITRGNRTFSAAACEQMVPKYSACEKAAAACDSTYDAETCLAAADTCQSLYNVFQQEVVPGGWNPYDDRKQCEGPPICGDMGEFAAMALVRSLLTLSARDGAGRPVSQQGLGSTGSGP